MSNTSSTSGGGTGTYGYGSNGPSNEYSRPPTATASALGALSLTSSTSSNAVGPHAPLPPGHRSTNSNSNNNSSSNIARRRTSSNHIVAVPTPAFHASSSGGDSGELSARDGGGGDDSFKLDGSGDGKKIDAAKRRTTSVRASSISSIDGVRAESATSSTSSHSSTSSMIGRRTSGSGDPFPASTLSTIKSPRRAAVAITPTSGGGGGSGADTIDKSFASSSSNKADKRSSVSGNNGMTERTIASSSKPAASRPDMPISSPISSTKSRTSSVSSSGPPNPPGNGSGSGNITIGLSSATTLPIVAAKPPKPLTKKKQKLLKEQTTLSSVATLAGALHEERRDIELRLASRKKILADAATHSTRVDEAGRLYTESAFDRLYDAQRATVLIALEESLYAQSEWMNYIACNPLPNVDVVSELNSFISLFRDSCGPSSSSSSSDDANAVAPHLQLQSILDACATCEDVCSLLSTRAGSALEDKNLDAASRCDAYTTLLHELVAQKMDGLTCRFLHRTDEYETGEERAYAVSASATSIKDSPPGSSSMSSSSSNATLTSASSDALAPASSSSSATLAAVRPGTVGFGLWCHNSSKAARVRRIGFDALGLSIELPQSLQKSRTCIRAIRTSYDHVTRRTYAPGNPSGYAPTPSAGAGSGAGGATGAAGKVQRSTSGDVRSTASGSAQSRATTTSSTPAELNRVASNASMSRRAFAAASAASAESLSSGEASSAQAVYVTRPPLPAVQNPALSMIDQATRDPTAIFDFARSSSSSSSSSDNEPLSPSSSAAAKAELALATSLANLNLRSHHVTLGGVIELQQLLLPPPAKKIKSWVMRESSAFEKVLVPVPYPTEDASASALSAAAASTANGGTGSLSAAQHTSSSTTAQVAPLRLTFSLPEHIYIPESGPSFGCWDYGLSSGSGGGSSVHSATSGWKQSGIVVQNYDARTRLVSLSLSSIRPLAVIQARALDFPFRSWSILPSPRAARRDANDYDSEDDGDPSESVQAHSCILSVTGSRFTVALEARGLNVRLLSPEATSWNKSLKALQEWLSPGDMCARLAEIGLRIAPSDADALYCRKPLKSPELVQTLHSHIALLTQVFDVCSSSHNVSRNTRSATIRVRLSRSSALLETAAAKRAILDWEAADEESERLDLPIDESSYRNFPSSYSSNSDDNDNDENGNLRPEAAERRRLAAVAESDARDDAEALAALAASLGYSRPQTTDDGREGKKKGSQQEGADTPARVVPVPGMTQEQKYALGFEWVTVLAELIDAPSDPTLANAASSHTSSSSSSSSSRHPLNGRRLTAVERATGDAHEGLPAGVLLKFTIIVGSSSTSSSSSADNRCDETPMAGCTSHFSLRRCLLAHFAELTPHDLTTAMRMAVHKEGRTGSAAASTSSTVQPQSQQYNFIPFEPITLQTQQTVRRMMNLIRPVVFG